jgi:hypothetical protein
MEGICTTVSLQGESEKARRSDKGDKLDKPSKKVASFRKSSNYQAASESDCKETQVRGRSQVNNKQESARMV